MFGNSVGDTGFYGKMQLENVTVRRNGNVKAVVGAGHLWLLTEVLVILEKVL
jgi:hypothetical protein